MYQENVSHVRFVIRCPITKLSMEEGTSLICAVCKAPVKPTEPVGPPMADHRVVHLRCWIRKRQDVTDVTRPILPLHVESRRDDNGRDGSGPG